MANSRAHWRDRMNSETGESVPNEDSGRHPHGTNVRVLYIAGAGRSGSTIVDNILGQIPGFFSAGEIAYFWQRFIVERRRCGCGEVGTNCPVWSKILTQIGSPGPDIASAMVSAARSATRIRHVPSMVAPGGANRLHAALGTQYLDRLSGLYGAIRETSGSRVIVDSSKFPGYGKAVSSLDGVDMSVIHLVRDPRAVAYSWLRQKPQPDTDSRSHMMQRRARTVAPRWMTANIAAEALFSRGNTPYARVRYEDFAAEPRKTLDNALQRLGLEQLPTGIIADGHAELDTTHTVSGNPSRFSTGRVALRVDDEWRSALKPKDSRVVTSLTFPLLARYGYLSG